MPTIARFRCRAVPFLTRARVPRRCARAATGSGGGMLVTVGAMHALAIVLALTSLITNARVAVTDGSDTGTRSHDAVVVDPKAATARFVKSGTPLGAKDRSVIIELLAPPV